MPKPARARMLRTRAEVFQAGWDDGANDRPLSPSEITRLALLIRPYIRLDAAPQPVAAAAQ